MARPSDDAREAREFSARMRWIEHVEAPMIREMRKALARNLRTARVALRAARAQQGTVYADAIMAYLRAVEACAPYVRECSPLKKGA